MRFETLKKIGLLFTRYYLSILTEKENEDWYQKEIISLKRKIRFNVAAKEI